MSTPDENVKKDGLSADELGMIIYGAERDLEGSVDTLRKILVTVSQKSIEAMPKERIIAQSKKLKELLEKK